MVEVVNLVSCASVVPEDTGVVVEEVVPPSSASLDGWYFVIVDVKNRVSPRVEDEVAEGC